VPRLLINTRQRRTRNLQLHRTDFRIADHSSRIAGLAADPVRGPQRAYLWIPDFEWTQAGSAKEQSRSLM